MRSRPTEAVINTKNKRYLQDTSVDQIVDSIEETFKAAQDIPKHPTRPEIVAEEVYPLVPGLDFLWNYYALVRFRESPSSIIENPSFEPKDKVDLFNNSIASCSVSTKGEQFLNCNLLVPHIDPSFQDIETFLDEPDEQREYSLAAVFEFIETEMNQKDHLFFAVDPDLKICTFNKIGTSYNARLRLVSLSLLLFLLLVLILCFLLF